MGASEYFRQMGIKNKGLLPQIDKSSASRIFSTLQQAIENSSIVSCHDCSEGGLAVALAEMCLAANLGATVFLEEVPTDKELFNYEILFSETPSRFLVEVKKDKKDAFEKTCQAIPWGLLGCVSPESELIVYGVSEQSNLPGKKSTIIIKESLIDLYVAGVKTFKEFR